MRSQAWLLSQRSGKRRDFESFQPVVQVSVFIGCNALHVLTLQHLCLKSVQRFVNTDMRLMSGIA
jgi:hypothetical protein